MRIAGMILGASVLLTTACTQAVDAPGTGESAAASVESPLEATGSVAFYVNVTGAKQGAFAGESTAKAHLGSIPAFRFSMEEKSPTDLASGQATGKTVSSDITLTKAFGASDPEFVQALTTNETLTTVTFTFVKIDATGKETTWQTLVLKNARATDVSRSTIELDDAAKTSMLADAISLSFQSATLTDTASGRTTQFDH